MSNWNDKLFFDNGIDRTCLRYSQDQLAFQVILDHKDWFGKDRSKISGYLYNLIWIVASGKSLAIPVVAFAYNYMMRFLYGESTDKRAKSVLVLSKERNLRDQLCDDISEGMAKHEVCFIKPRVKVVDDGDFFDNLNNIDDYDIVFSCIQQLWNKKANGRSDKIIENILGKFQLVFVDEPHFSSEQVNRIVKLASNSLCFGTTGTPFDCDGSVLDNQIMLSLYDKDAANIHDHSLKYISDNINEYLQVIDIINADMQKGHQRYTTSDANLPGYSFGSTPINTVAAEVIRHIKFCDDIAKREIADRVIAPHREIYKDKIAKLFFYHTHGIINVPGKKQALQLRKDLDAYFQNNRKDFPIEEGWTVSIAMSDHCDDTTNVKEKIPKLDKDHPWLMAKHNGGKLVANRGKKQIYGSRLVILVGYGREGLDNAYNGVMGIAASKSSLQEIVQRIGRELRAIIKINDDGTIDVPPKCLDSVKLVTHTTFYEDGETYKSAHDFIHNMSEWLQDMTTIEDLKRGELPDEPSILDKNVLSDQERFAIAGLICREQKKFPDCDVDECFKDLIATSFSGNSERKREKVKEWIDIVEKNPSEACSRIGLFVELDAIPAVLSEEFNIKRTTKELLEWLKVTHPAESAVVGDNPDGIALKLIEGWHKTHCDKFKLSSPSSITNVEEIRKELRSKIIQKVMYIGKMNGCPYYADGQLRDKVIAKIATFIALGVKQIIGTDQSVNIGGEWDKPQYHAIFNRPNVQKKIAGFVVAMLAKNGYIPDLDYLIDQSDSQ